MSYDLERQHKERRLIFEMEMQNRLYYLWNVNKLVDYSIHSLPTQSTSGYHQGNSSVTLTAKGVSDCDKTADNHIPMDINEWLHERTHDLGEYTK